MSGRRHARAGAGLLAAGAGSAAASEGPSIAVQSAGSIALTLLDIHEQATVVAVGLAAFAFLGIGCSLLMGQIPARWFWSVFAGVVSLGVVNQVAGFIIGNAAGEASTGAVEQIQREAYRARSEAWAGTPYSPMRVDEDGNRVEDPDNEDRWGRGAHEWRRFNEERNALEEIGREQDPERWARDDARISELVGRYCRHVNVYSCAFVQDTRTNEVRLRVRERTAEEAGHGAGGRTVEEIRLESVPASRVTVINPAPIRTTETPDESPEG